MSDFLIFSCVYIGGVLLMSRFLVWVLKINDKDLVIGSSLLWPFTMPVVIVITAVLFLEAAVNSPFVLRVVFGILDKQKDSSSKQPRREEAAQQ